MRYTTMLALAGVALLGTGAAQAQDLFSGSAGNWNGIYAGLQADLLAQKSLEESVPPTTETILGDMGGGIGAFIGYDYQLSDLLVVGVGAEANYDSTELLANSVNLGKARWDAAVKARVGVPVASNVLVYGSLGYSWGHFDSTDTFPSPTFTSNEYTVNGAQFGIGVDAMLTANIMGRIEATYTHYGTNTIMSGGAPVHNSTPSMIAVKAGVGLRF